MTHTSEPLIDPKDIKHICRFDRIGYDGEIDSYLALSGFKTSGKSIYVTVVDANRATASRLETKQSFEIRGEVADFVGTIVQEFEAALEASPKRSVVYEGETYTKMTAKEVRALLAGVTLRDPNVRRRAPKP